MEDRRSAKAGAEPPKESPFAVLREPEVSNDKINQENIMAVQQNKKSPSKRGMHRAHDHLGKPPVAVEPTTGETHLRHHISPSGYYRGKKVIQTKD